MSLSTTAARGAFTTVFGQWIKFALQTLSIVALARILTPDDFGVVAMVTAVSGIATLLADFGLSMASLRDHLISNQNKSNLFWINLCIGAFAAAIVFIAAHPLSIFYDVPAVEGIAQAMAIIYILQAFNAQFRAELSRSFRFLTLAKIDITAQAIAVTAAIIAGIMGAGYWALVFQQVSIVTVQVVLLILFARWRPTWPKKDPNLKSYLRFGLKASGLQFVNYFTSNVDSTLIGKFIGTQPLGIYNQAYQIFRVPLQQIAAPMTQVAVPILSKISDDTTFEKYVLRAQLILSYLLIGSFIFAISVATPLLAILLGPGWGNISLVFSVLAIGGIFQALGYVYYWICLARDLTAKQLKVGTISRILMVIFMLVGVKFGILGVAAGGSLGLALNWVLLSIFVIPHARLSVLRMIGVTMRPMFLFLIIGASVFAFLQWLPGSVTDVLRLTYCILLALTLMSLAVLTIPKFRIDFYLIISTVKSAKQSR
ncbi:lipopolysaccharide biosynthesis protein [Arthrobacter sp. E3]|uniref:oligosaccharide flippase family protein n=1 Tax=Arthrobacter sp. E3 TaxID=517402 RepID=UPI001A94B79E